jgi:surface protein
MFQFKFLLLLSVSWVVAVPTCTYSSTDDRSCGLRKAVDEYLDTTTQQATIANYGEVSNWDVSNHTDFSAAFKSTTFNGDLSKWDTSKVTSLSYSKYKLQKYHLFFSTNHVLQNIILLFFFVPLILQTINIYNNNCLY